MSVELVRAAGFILFRQTTEVEYLLMKASYGSKHWTPPKGHVDPGENDFETALRETKEEAGFENNIHFKTIEDFKIEQRYNVKSHIDGITRPKLVTYWLGQMISGNPEVRLSEEHSEYKWVNLQEANKLYPQFAESFNKCQKYIDEKK